MTCPYLEYRPLSDAEASDDADGSEAGRTGDDDRAYCTAAEKFVQPMRADICNDRYDLDHETDCEIYREAEGLPEVPEDEGAGDADAGTGGESA